MERLIRPLSCIALFLCLPLTAPAAVTYDGTEGVRSRVFASNSVQGCMDCHSSTLVGFEARQSAPDEVDFNTYALATKIPSYLAGDANRNSVRAKVRGADDLTMPALGALNATERNLLTNWISQGALQRAAPSVTTSAASSVGKYGATLTGTFNDNGADATYHVDWRRTGASYGSANSGSQTYYTTIAASASTSPPASDPFRWTGGGISTKPVSHALSGLSCGTTYFFRMRGTNSAGTSTATERSFVTSACNTPPSFNNLPATVAATEKVLFTRNLQATDPQGDNVTFCLQSAPAGMVIRNTSTSAQGQTCTSPSGDSTRCQIRWTPDDPVVTPALVTVRAGDAGASGNVCQTGVDGAVPASGTLTINVTLVNDPPTITSSAPQSATQGNIYSYQLAVSDPDDDVFTYELLTAPAGMTVSGTGLIQWSVPPDSATSVPVQVRVSDGELTDSQSWTVTVQEFNFPPEIVSTPILVATEGVLYEYQLAVEDPDDANNGVDLTYSFGRAPSGMTISATGLIRWTPGEGGTDPWSVTVEVTVADGGENGAMPDTQGWEITVTPVNDPPVLTPIADQSVEELSTFGYTVQVFDPDDPNDGVALTWSLLKAPTGMMISPVGVISWTPGQFTAGEYPVVVQVADGGEDSAQPDTTDFMLTVTLLDRDGDLVPDYADNCPDDFNPDQADMSGNGIGDACDPDIDGDGIPNHIEELYGLDPRDPSDALGDLDGDGLTNLEEYLTCVEEAAGAPVETCDAISNDSVAPVITVEAVRVDSEGYLTAVTLEAEAIDGVDGPVTAYVIAINDRPLKASLASGNTYDFRPGRHVVLWQAKDSAGNVAEQEQTVDVLPQVILGGSLVMGRDQTLHIPIRLSGPAPSYPVTIGYSFSGSARGGVDFSFPESQFVVAEGTEGGMDISVISSGLARDDRHVDIVATTVAGDAILGDGGTFRVLIVDRQVAPEASITISQSGRAGNRVYQGQGDVEILINARDANNDPLSFNWSRSDTVLGLSGDQSLQTLTPDVLDPGAYRIDVQVSDGVNTVSQTALLLIEAAMPALVDQVEQFDDEGNFIGLLDVDRDSDGDGIPDAEEGVADSDGDGIPDYLDAIDEPTIQQLTASRGGVDLRHAIRTEAGLQINIGEHALLAGRHGVRLRQGDVAADEENVLLGAIYDFEIHGLTEAKRSAAVVIPLLQKLPPGAVWRKYIDGKWRGFTETGEDTLASAASRDGECPAHDAGRWRAGLNVGHDCVRLVLTDGGPNDADGVVNGVIRDPSAPALMPAVPVEAEIPTEKPNSAGALFWMFALLLLPFWRRLRR